MKVINEYRATSWKIADLDPDTSGKYIFDYMTYSPHSVCQNCGHKHIAWNCHIHDAENPEKKFVVGDDCINFLLAISDGLINVDDLKKFREAKDSLVNLFNWLRKQSIDLATFDGVVGFVNKGSAAPSDQDIIEVIRPYPTDSGFFKVPTTKDGRLLRPYRLIAPNFKIDDWLKFFPKIKRVLISYESDQPQGGFFISDKNNELFAKLNREGSQFYYTSKVRQLCIQAFGSDEAGEKEVDTPLGKFKAVKPKPIYLAHYDTHGLYIFREDGREYDTNLAIHADVKLPTVGCVWTNTIEPIFPSDCAVELDKFLTVDKNNEMCKDQCSKSGDEARAEIERIQREEEEKNRAKREEEERRAREEAARKAEEDRQNNIRTEAYNSLISDPDTILNGLNGHVVLGSWITRFRDPLKSLISKKLTEAMATTANAPALTIQVGNCVSTFMLRYKDQIDQLKKMDPAGRTRYLRNIVAKISTKYNRPTEWEADVQGAKAKFTFNCTDLKDTPTGEATVIGNTSITITPVIPANTPPANTPPAETPPVSVTEDSKITLTLEQIQMLIAEARKTL